MKKASFKLIERQKKANHRLRKSNCRGRKKQVPVRGNEELVYKLDAPRVIDIRSKDNRRQFLSFINKLLVVKSKKRYLRISFEATKHIIPEAMILFVSKLKQVCISNSDYHNIKVVPPRSLTCEDAEKIRQVLYRLRVYKITGQNITAECNHPQVINWHQMHGNVSDVFEPEKIKNFLQVDGRDAESVLHKAFKEALINIQHHAYKSSSSGDWLAFVRAEGSIRTIVVCDLGIGIPESIAGGDNDAQKEIFGRVKKVANRFGRNPLDSEFIRGSVKLGVSGTGEKGRGKGLPQMKRVVDSIESSGSRLNIYSNRGCYTVFSGNITPQISNYKDSVGGTIITWSVPVRVN